VLITSVTRGSINVEFVILGFNNLSQKNYPDRIDKARTTLSLNLKVKDVDVKKISMTYVMELSDFDRRGDFKFSHANE